MITYEVILRDTGAEIRTVLKKRTSFEVLQYLLNRYNHPLSNFKEITIREISSEA